MYETAGISLIEIYLPRKKPNNILNWETKENKDMIYESRVPHISVIFLNRPLFITVQAKQALTLRGFLKRARQLWFG